MRNIWTIFTRDIRKIRTNVIALIVVLGVTVVPCLYAWFNIAASWDPYGNTGNLKVAVASVDEGYIGNLIPLQLNLGDQVLSALRENTQLNWVFTTKSKAMKGVKSGEYYAAIVIPEDFSTNLMSVFSSDIKETRNYLLLQCKRKCHCTEGNRQRSNRSPDTGQRSIYRNHFRYGADCTSDCCKYRRLQGFG